MRTIDLVSKYVRKLKREQLHSPRTIISYESDLKQFAQYAGESREIHTISEHLINRYFRDLTDARRLSPSTISRKICTVRGFFQYLENDDILLRSPVSRFHLKIKIHRKSPTYITPEEISQLFNVIREEYQNTGKKLQKRRDRGDKDRLVEYQLFCNVRNSVLFRILLLTGIKLGELVTIKSEQVQLLIKSCIIYPERNVKDQYKITNPETLNLLRKYRKQVKYFNFRSHFFFFNRNMGQLSTVIIQKIFKSYIDRAGIKRKLTPSSLRHAFAVNLFQQQTDLNTIRDKLGYKTFEGLLLYQKYFNTSSQSKHDNKS